MPTYVKVVVVNAHNSRKTFLKTLFHKPKLWLARQCPDDQKLLAVIILGLTGTKIDKPITALLVF